MIQVVPLFFCICGCDWWCGFLCGFKLIFRMSFRLSFWTKWRIFHSENPSKIPQFIRFPATYSRPFLPKIWNGRKFTSNTLWNTVLRDLLMSNFNGILDGKNFIFYPFCDQRKQGSQEWQSTYWSNHYIEWRKIIIFDRKTCEGRYSLVSIKSKIDCRLSVM